MEHGDIRHQVDTLSRRTDEIRRVMPEQQLEWLADELDQSENATAQAIDRLRKSMEGRLDVVDATQKRLRTMGTTLLVTLIVALAGSPVAFLWAIAQIKATTP